MLQKFATCNEPTVIEPLARACLLGPAPDETGEFLPRVAPLVERLSKANPRLNNWQQLFANFVIGLAEYRGGHFDRAIARMKDLNLFRSHHCGFADVGVENRSISPAISPLLSSSARWLCPTDGTPSPSNCACTARLPRAGRFSHFYTTRSTWTVGTHGNTSAISDTAAGCCRNREQIQLDLVMARAVQQKLVVEDIQAVDLHGLVLHPGIRVGDAGRGGRWHVCGRCQMGDASGHQQHERTGALVCMDHRLFSKGIPND